MKLLLCFLFFASESLLAEQPSLTEEIRALAEDRGESQLEEENRIPAEEGIEKIKVTGSRIKRIDIEGPSPVTIFNKEDLENSGYSSVGDFLRETNVSHLGVEREQSGSSTSGNSFTFLSGGKALILLNGMRIAEDPHGEAVDLNLVPLFAIERVEILKGSGSSVYGSDAVGGVINFITKQGFNGAELIAQINQPAYPLYKGGTELNTGVVFGASKQQWSYISLFQLRFKDSILDSERSWNKESFSTIGPYPTFNGIAHPKCPDPVQNGCQFNAGEYATRYPRYAQIYSFFKGDYKLGERVFYTQLIASYKNNKWGYAPLPVQLDIPANHPMEFGKGKAGTLRYRFMEAGNRDTIYNNFFADLTIGVKGYLSTTWDYNFSLTGSHIKKDDTSTGLLLEDKIKEAITSGKYNPEPESENKDISDALYTAEKGNSASLLMASLDFSGETGLLGIDLATGFQSYYKTYLTGADKETQAGNVASNYGSEGSADRYVLSYYLEAIKNFSNLLEIQGTGRVDYYSDFKFTFNPQLAFRIQPTSQFLIRGSIGQAFIAPYLSFLHEEKSEGFPYLFDTVACFNELKNTNKLDAVYSSLKGNEQTKEKLIKDFLSEQREVISKKSLPKSAKAKLKQLSKSFKDTDSCKDRQFAQVTSQGNKKLKETKALVAQIGSVWQINDDSNLSLDFWYVKEEKIPDEGITTEYRLYGFAKEIMDAELKLGADYLKAKGILINRNEKGDLVGIESKKLNLGEFQKAGANLNIDTVISQLKIGNGFPYLKNETSYLFISKFEGFPGLGLTSAIGKFGVPRWRNILTLGWKNEKHDISAQAHTSSSFAKKTSELEELGAYTRFDLDYIYLISEKTKLQLGWSNLLWSTPPIDEKATNNKLVHNIFEGRGPFLFAGIKYIL